MDPVENRNYLGELIKWAVYNPGALWQDNDDAARARQWLRRNAPDAFRSLYYNESDDIRSNIDRRFLPDGVAQELMEQGVTGAINDFGNDVYNVVDTATSYMPGPVGTINWLSHMGADLASGNWKDAVASGLMAGVMGGGAKAASKGLGYLATKSPWLNKTLSGAAELLDDLNWNRAARDAERARWDSNMEARRRWSGKGVDLGDSEAVNASGFYGPATTPEKATRIGVDSYDSGLFRDWVSKNYPNIDASKIKSMDDFPLYADVKPFASELDKFITARNRAYKIMVDAVNKGKMSPFVKPIVDGPHIDDRGILSPGRGVIGEMKYPVNANNLVKPYIFFSNEPIVEASMSSNGGNPLIKIGLSDYFDGSYKKRITDFGKKAYGLDDSHPLSFDPMFIVGHEVGHLHPGYNNAEHLGVYRGSSLFSDSPRYGNSYRGISQELKDKLAPVPKGDNVRLIPHDKELSEGFSDTQGMRTLMSIYNINDGISGNPYTRGDIKALNRILGNEQTRFSLFHPDVDDQVYLLNNAWGHGGTLLHKYDGGGYVSGAGDGSGNSYNDKIRKYSDAVNARKDAYKKHKAASDAYADYYDSIPDRVKYARDWAYWKDPTANKLVNAEQEAYRGISATTEDYINAEKDLGAATIDKYRGTSADLLKYEGWAKNENAARNYLIENGVRESIGAKEVADYFNSYVSSPGFERIINNQNEWKNSYHPYRRFDPAYWRSNYTSSARDLQKTLLKNPMGTFGVFDLSSYPGGGFNYINHNDGIHLIINSAGNPFLDQDKEKFPYWDELVHEMMHDYNFVEGGQGEALDQNTNTEEGHDSRRNEKHSDLEALRFLLYKEGIYDSRGERDATADDIKKLREKYPLLRQLEQMDDEKAAWMINHVAALDRDVDTANYAKLGGTLLRKYKVGGGLFKIIGEGIKNKIRRRLYDNMNPYGYGDDAGDSDDKRVVSALLGKREKEKDTYPMLRDDIFAEYLQIPEDERHTLDNASEDQKQFGIARVRDSEYSPSIGGEQKQYRAVDLTDDDKFRLVYEGLSLGNKNIGGSKALEGYFGPHTVSTGFDDRGQYVSYYDKWDINPSFGRDATKNSFLSKISPRGGSDASMSIGRPIDFYDRVYLDDYFGVDSSDIPADSVNGGYIRPAWINEVPGMSAEDYHLTGDDFTGGRPIPNRIH